MQKIVHLHNNVENDLKKTVLAYQLYGGQELVGQQKEQYYKRLYFRIKGVLFKRVAQDKIVFIEEQLNALPEFDNYSSIDSFYQLDDLLTRILSISPGDMVSPSSPYLRMIQKKLKLSFFMQLKGYARNHGLMISLLSIQDFINEKIEDLKEAERFKLRKKQERQKPKERTVHNYATETKVEDKQDKATEKGKDSKSSSKPKGCPCCKKDHHVTDCKIFIKMSKEDKRKVAEANKLCYYCLKYFHGYCGKAKKCSQCNRAHNHLLSCPPPKESDTAEKKEKEVKNFHIHTSATASSSTYSPFTVPCFVTNKSTGEAVATVAFIDNGSNSSILFKPLAEKIGMEGEETAILMTLMFW